MSNNKTLPEKGQPEVSACGAFLKSCRKVRGYSHDTHHWITKGALLDIIVICRCEERL